MKRSFGTKLILALLIVVLLMGTASADSWMENFKPVRTYSGQFQDVSAQSWYADTVAQAYSFGLIQGMSKTTFEPGGNLTVAECVTLAARLHSIYADDGMKFEASRPWYRVYVDYAMENRILLKEQSDYSRKISRAFFAQILARALPRDMVPAVNDVPDGAIPDVTEDLEAYDAIYRLYRGGVLLGNDKLGTFLPASKIKRSEAAAILLRMACPEQRLHFSLSTEITVYGKDGSTKVIPVTQLADYQSKGWYTEPVTKVYSYSGSTKVVEVSKVDAFLASHPDWAAEPFTGVEASLKKQNKTQTSIPVISVNTGGVEVLSKNNYVNCSVNVSNVPQSQALKGETGGIRLRGNASSFYGNVSKIRANPVPYRLKFDSKVNLMGLNDGLKAKSWVLLTNLDAEKDVVKNDFAFRVGRMLLEPDGAYASHAQMAHFYLNGVFQGTYLVCEQNQVNKGRVQVNEPEDGYTGTDVGYFVELDGYYEEPSFTMNYENATVTDVNGSTRTFRSNGYSIKSDVFSQAQKDFIAKYIRGVFKIVYQACEKGNYLTFDKNYNVVKSDFTSARQAVSAVADVRSMADMYILYELMCDYDVGESSFFMCVDFSADSQFPKLTFTAPWDFNWTCQGSVNGSVFAGAFRTSSFISSMGDRSNPWFIVLYKQNWFREIIKTRWAEIGGAQGIRQCIADEKAIIELYKSDFNRRGSGASASAYANLSWLEKRASYLDARWS